MEKVRIQDDLYHYVNGEWLEKAVIPDDKPTTGGFADLAKGVEELMISDFNKFSESKCYPNKYIERAVTLFNIIKDVERREKDGVTPALKTLNFIESINSIDDLNKNLKTFILEDLPLPFNIGVDSDMKDTNHHCLMIQGASVILPDATYYKEEMAQQKQMFLGLWSQMAMAVLKEYGLSDDVISSKIASTLKFDEILAKYVKTQEEWSEYTKMYNPTKTSTVVNYLKPFKFKALLSDLFGEAPSVVIVTEPRYFKAFKEIFNEETFMIFKDWCYVKEAINGSKLLTEKLRDLSGMYQRALSGIQKATSVEKYAYNLASMLYQEPVGLYYGETYFGEEAKKDIIEMVGEIVKTYQNRISKNEFLCAETKEKAIVKLTKMRVHMGYPDSVDGLYDLLEFNSSDSLYDIIRSLMKIKIADSLSKLYEDVNRDKWVMPGHMVNACYNPFTNDITFPAAILQAPFYSIKQTRSENLGGIGAVIGHEISHAFDNNGAKCDENGNINNWWTKEDEKMFKKQTKRMIKEFDGIELPWGKVNGAFIVSENIADNGGMASTLEIMENMENANYEEYFKNWARVWCVKAKEEYLQLLLKVDVHGPAILRANMQPRNFDKWYETFNVKKTDKMYLDKSKRVVIW